MATLEQVQASKKAMFIGADEVGYGSLAGPVVICSVMAPKDWKLEGLNDSKKLSEKKRNLMRDKLLKLVEKKEISFHMAERTSTEIDATGVASALKACYIEGITTLDIKKECLIVTDGILKFDGLGVDDYDIVNLIKADTLIPTVMAASILAKTYRDEKMKKFHYQYPVYNWKKNVGYAAKDHTDGITQFGPCVLHRFSYAPMRLMDLKTISLYQGV